MFDVLTALGFGVMLGLTVARIIMIRDPVSVKQTVQEVTMSWKSGQRILEQLWQRLAPLLPQDVKPEAARRIMQVFKDHDCDIPADSNVARIARREGVDEIW